MDRESLFKHLNHRYCSKHEMLSRIPLGVQPDALWQELLQHRRTQSTALPIYAPNGNPYWYVTTDRMIAASEKIVETLYTDGADFDPFTEPPPVVTLEESFFTSYVEGAQITMQAAMDFLASGEQPRDIEEQMIANNRMAGKFATENLYRGIDTEFLRGLAYLLTDGMDNGGQDYRMTDDAEYAGTGGEQFSFPPAATIPDRIEALCAYLASPQSHPLIKAGVAQGYMQILQPFPEGSDRIGRILSSMILLRAGYTFFSDVSLSALIARKSYAYYEATANILREDNGGDLTYFLEFFMELLSRAVDERALRQQRREEQDLQTEQQLARTALTAPAIPPPDSLPDEPVGDPPKQPELPPAAVETPGKEEEGDLLDGFFTVPAQEPDAKPVLLQNRVPERSMEQIRELLLEAANNRGANIRRCAEMLLGYFNQGKQFFTRKEIAEDCGFDPSQTSDMITQFRSKGIIRKEEATNKKQGLYCFNVRESALLQNSDPHSAEHTEGHSPLDSFPTVSVQESDEPAPASDNRITETNMDYIRELLIKCKESYGERLKKCSILLLDFLDQGKYTFTQADIAAGCDLESKQSANMILHLRSKGIIESCRKWEGSYMLYRFRTDQLSPVLQCTDHVAEKDDLLDDPGDAAQAQHAKISLRRVRNKLYDLTESSGSVFRVGARHLLNLMDAGMETFTIDDFLETPYISGKRLNNFITHMKAKSLIESCGEREENRHMAYRFSTSMPPLTEDDYDPDLLEIVRQLRESSGSQKDRRIGCALFANLPQGIIMSQDYPDYKDTAKMASDMSLAEQMGLVTKIKPYVYRINRQRSYLLPSLSRTQTAVLSQTFECFDNSWFSLQDAYDTLALKRTKICATIHQLVQLNIAECQEGKRNTYRLLVNPTDYPALFGRKADGQETEKSGLELITQASKTEQQSLYEMPYSDEYYAMLDALEQSADTPDRRLAQVLRQCLDKGYVVRDDYLQQGYTENQWGKDMEMALALGLVRSGGRGKRTLNRTVDFARDELRPHLKRAISAIYETFGDQIFSCEMFTATLNYSMSRTYASLHNLALLKVVDQTDTEYGRQYRLLVNPADNPEWFDAA